MGLARRNLLQEKLRFGLSMTGIALRGHADVVLNGILSGVMTQAGAYLDTPPARSSSLPPVPITSCWQPPPLPAGTEAAV